MCILCMLLASESLESMEKSKTVRKWQLGKIKCFCLFLDKCPCAFMYQKYVINCIYILNQLSAYLNYYSAPWGWKQ